MVKFFQVKYKEQLNEMFEDLRTDYDWILAGLYYFKSIAEMQNRNVVRVFQQEVDIKIKSFKTKANVTILLVDEAENMHGMFDYEGKIPQIAIQLEMRDIPDSDNEEDQHSLIRKFQVYLSHELMHCYQYLSKNNFIERENTSASEAIPYSFSYLVYFLSSNEIESNAMSAQSQFKKGKKQGVTFCNQLLRIIDFHISDKENMIDKLHLTPQYLAEKYKKFNDLNDLLCLDYILGVFIPSSRFAGLCKMDKNYVKYIATLNVSDLKKRMQIIEQIYNFLEEKFSDKNYQHLPQAFYLISNKDSLNKICSSTDYASQVYEKIIDGNFTDNDRIYDEEEDTIVYGRPDIGN